ncbi:hypothetical protein BOVMAS24_15110 [Streptococcus uberis]
MILTRETLVSLCKREVAILRTSELLQDISERSLTMANHRIDRVGMEIKREVNAILQKKFVIHA